MYLGSLASSSAKFVGLKMGLRLLILLVVGLGALYTIHLLAQDFMKFTTRIGSASSFLSGKRDVESADVWTNITQQRIEFENKIDWDKILQRDPFSCALSIVCQLSAGAEKNNEEANSIYEFLSHAIEHSKVPKKLKKSYEQGIEYNKNDKQDFTKCYKSYPLCPYSAETMIKFITFNKFLFG